MLAGRLPFLAGIALGVANSMSNAFGSAYGPFTTTPGQGVRWLEYVSSWLGTPWAWALFAFGVGWFTRRLGAAALLATAGLLLAVLTYYVSDAMLGVTDRLSVVEIQLWSVISLFVGPVMAVLGVLAQRARGWSLAPGLAAPALMVVLRPHPPQRQPADRAVGPMGGARGRRPAGTRAHGQSTPPDSAHETA